MTAPPFQFSHLDHIVLRTANPVRMQQFYEILGCEVALDRSDELGLVQLRLGESMLDIVDINGRVGQMGDTGAGPAVDGRNVDHFAVRVESFDQEAIMAFCKEQGIEAESPDYPLLGADGYGHAVYIKDPEGNRVELKGPPVKQLGD